MLFREIARQSYIDVELQEFIVEKRFIVKEVAVLNKRIFIRILTHYIFAIEFSDDIWQILGFYHELR